MKLQSLIKSFASDLALCLVNRTMHQLKSWKVGYWF